LSQTSNSITFSNSNSGSTQLYTCDTPGSEWAAILLPDGSAYTESSIDLPTAANQQVYFLFASSAISPSQVNNFIKIYRPYLSNAYRQQFPVNLTMAWLFNPLAAPTIGNTIAINFNQVSGNNFIVSQTFQTTTIGGPAGANFAFLTIVNNTALTFVPSNAPDSMQLVQITRPPNFTFGNQVIGTKSLINSNITIPFTGSGTGSFRFSLGFNYSNDFQAYGLENKYYSGSAANLTVFSYPTLLPGTNANDYVITQAQIDLLDIGNARGLNTYFALTGQIVNQQTGAQRAASFPSNYTTNFGCPLTLWPLINFIDNKAPVNNLFATQFSARFIISPQDAAGTQTFYLTPEGDFYLDPGSTAGSPDTNGQFKLMAGLSGTESITFTPYSNVTGPTGDTIRFLGRQAAYIPNFPVQASGNVVGSNTTQNWLSADYFTSWAAIVQATTSKAAITYYAQPNGGELYSQSTDPTSALFTHFDTGAGVLSMAANPVFVPLVPYGDASASSAAATAQIALFEKQVLNPNRKKIISNLKLQASAGAAGNNIPSTNPQGFYINVNPQNGVWEQLLLASNTANNSAGFMSLQFQPASATLQSALQSNQLFLVISYDNGTALTNFSNEIEIEGWPFKLDVPTSSVNGKYSNVIIFKYCQGALIDKVQNIQGWNMPDVFNDTSSNGLPNLSMWLQGYIQAGMDKFTVQHDNDYAKFYNIATQPGWQGVIALGVDISVQDFPKELQGLLAGIDESRFYAHHFGIDVSIVTNNQGTVGMQSTSSLFGLIDYEDQLFQSLGGVPAVYQQQAPINGSVDYDFKVLKLKVVFINSKIYNYNSYLAFTINKLFGEQVDPANRNNLLIFTGTYENHNGVPSYTFLNTGDNLLNLVEDNIITDVEIIKASFVTIVPQDGTGGNTVNARFGFWGFINYTELPGFDLFSFGAETSSGAPNYQGLSYASLYINLNFNLNTPTTKTFAFDITHTTFDIGQSTPREDSLYSHFPLQLSGITTGDAGNTPASQGYLNVSVQSMQQQAVSGTWYGLVFNLNMGTLGSLSTAAGFNSTFMMAWNVGAKGAWAGVKLPGVNPQAPSFSLQGILKLDIGSIVLQRATGTTGVAYIMKINNIALKLFSLSFPPGGNISMMLFGNPAVDARPESLGWYGAYVKS